MKNQLTSDADRVNINTIYKNAVLRGFMATSKGYLSFVLEQLSDLEGISYRSMMGEYIIYYRGVISAYLCDDRLLVKPLSAVLKLMPNARYETPYEGAKEMLLVEKVDDRDFLTGLFKTIYAELPKSQKWK